MPQRNKTVKIAPWAVPILRNLKVEGPLVRIREKLERADYVAVDKILKALGGKWSRKDKVHVFPSDAQPLLDAALADGAAVDTKKTLDQFDTPLELARLMVELAQVREYDAVLEPSAGVGNLVKAIYETGQPHRVKMVELDIGRAQQLRDTFGFNAEVWQGDFLEIEDYDEFDVILMNPPFSNSQDIRHIWHAWSYLRWGGRLVAAMSVHSSFASDQASTEFATWLTEVGAQIHEIPAGTFKESGTEIRAQLIVVEKGAVVPAAAGNRIGNAGAYIGGRWRRREEPGPLLAKMGVK